MDLMGSSLPIPAAGATQSSGGSMNIKTNGGENKKVKLGFGLSGYKSVIQRLQAAATPTANGGIGSDADIMWLISTFGAGEAGKTGFSQCEFNVGHDKDGKGGDGVGWTVGGWSITQKWNFKILGEKYMPNHNLSADICNQIVNADPGNEAPTNDAELEKLVSKLTNSKQVNGHGVPDNRDNDENVVNFVHATTEMFINMWYPTAVQIMNKWGFKTRLGMATIMRAVGWTGGDSNLIDNPFRGDSKRNFETV